jgi:hypothetical protein
MLPGISYVDGEIPSITPIKWVTLVPCFGMVARIVVQRLDFLEQNVLFFAIKASRQIMRYDNEPGHKRFLSHPFLFITHYSSGSDIV